MKTFEPQVDNDLEQERKDSIVEDPFNSNQSDSNDDVVLQDFYRLESKKSGLI